MTRPRLRHACALVAAAQAALLVACNVPPQSDAPAAAAERGRVLLARHHCGSCHTIPGVAAAQGRLAASLAGYGKRSYIAGRVANRSEALARWIAEPQAIAPGTLMPDMGASDADARDMAAYLGQLR